MTELKVGAVVNVVSGNGRNSPLYSANIFSISKTGKKIDITHPKTGSRLSFYRQAYNEKLYVFSPGSGLCGAMLNDRFTI